tara:strand:+ start:459 stop:653 length:195 start_codon:yes stop_codon:yes gene_type:complete
VAAAEVVADTNQRVLAEVQVEQVVAAQVEVIAEVQSLLQEPLIRAAVVVVHRALESEQLVVQAS